MCWDTILNNKFGPHLFPHMWPITTTLKGPTLHARVSEMWLLNCMWAIVCLPFTCSLFSHGSGNKMCHHLWSVQYFCNWRQFPNVSHAGKGHNLWSFSSIWASQLGRSQSIMKPCLIILLNMQKLSNSISKKDSITVILQKYVHISLTGNVASYECRKDYPNWMNALNPL